MKKIKVDLNKKYKPSDIVRNHILSTPSGNYHSTVDYVRRLCKSNELQAINYSSGDNPRYYINGGELSRYLTEKGIEHHTV